MMQGTIIKALSGFYYVQDGTETVECRAPGRFRREKLVPLVGDKVEFDNLGGGKGILKAILPRKNWFSRPAVANMDMMVILASNVIPVTEPFLIDRVAAVAESRGCEPVICINKCDLDRADRLFDIYTHAGFVTLRVSAASGEGISELKELLSGKNIVFTGNSGVGKSSVLNRLSPDLDIPTGDVSHKLGRGRHTTRHIELFPIADGMVADTPGFASFDAFEGEMREPERIQYLFREFAPYLNLCRFARCSHVKEEGCAVLEAVGMGKISESRHRSYTVLYNQAKEIPQWER